MTDRIYVCSRCAHTVSNPEWPDRCENCRRDGIFLESFSDIEAAELYSERVLESRFAVPASGGGGGETA